MALEIDLLADRYEVGRLLGSGGMAQVFEGRDRLLDRRVAIKLLHERFASDPEFLARFRREARAAAGLSHAGIVAVYDTGEHEGTHYIVMEHVEGRTLAEVLAADDALPTDRVVWLVGEVAAALAAAHARGLVHRDVKPGNVMLTSEDRVKVMDFGIARAVENATALTATSGVLGTPRYMSPEQVEGRSLDARSDLYSLGVCLYEWLTGAVPFDGTTALSIAAQHVNVPPRPPRELRADIPPAVEAVTLRALAKDPADRPQTGQQLRAELEAALDGNAPAPAPVDKPTHMAPAAAAAAAGSVAAPTARVVDRDEPAPLVTHGPAMGPRRVPWGRVAAVIAVLLILGAAGAALGRSLGARTPAAPVPAQSPAAGEQPVIPPVTPGPTEQSSSGSSGTDSDEDAGVPAPSPAASPEASAEQETTATPAPEPSAPPPTETTAPSAPPTTATEPTEETEEAESE